jgi:hypothetical protein
MRKLVDCFSEIAAGLLFAAYAVVAVAGLALPLLIVAGVLPR